MSTNPPTILHVDDDPRFLDLTSTMFQRLAPELDIRTAHTVDDALATLEVTSVDCIVSDFDMPGKDGLAFLEAVRERDEHAPFVLLTGKGSEEIASEAISAGVDDYIQKSSGKDEFELLVNRVENLIEKHHVEAQIKEVYDAIDHINQGVSLLNGTGEFIYVNQSYAETFGYRPEEMIGQHWEILYRDDHDVEYMKTDVLATMSPDSNWNGRTRQCRRDGTEIQTDHTLAFTRGNKLVCLVSETEPVGLDADDPVVDPE